MEYNITFHNLVTDISINPNISLNQAKFIYSRHGGVVNRNNKLTYPEVRGIQVSFRLDKEPGEGRKLLEPLERGLYIVEEILTGLVVRTQGFCYLTKPIVCTFNNKKFVLEGNFWREQMPLDDIYHGGEVFLDDADFIDEDKNFHPMFHFYRAAKDETNSSDYRALNAWRFLEALHGKGDRELLEHLVDHEKQPKELVEDFYKNIRCAVAHAKLLKSDPLTDKVILPKSYETEFDGALMMDLIKITKYMDSIVRRLKPATTDIGR